MTPRRLFRIVAVTEAITWCLLIIGMLLKYVTRTTDLGVTIGGGLHGFVFLCYLAVTCMVAVDKSWPLGTTVLGLAAAFLPGATIAFERRVQAQDRLDDAPWRLGAGQSSPTGPLEKLVAFLLRRPALSAVVIVVGIGCVFGGLLVLGPPGEWG